ncbi:MAG: methyltransferase domain-containing protein [Planctomycetota bacterium]|nr:MAG: methyltransferase domain-containing protein [Planctomycetota bacterium]
MSSGSASASRRAGAGWSRTWPPWPIRRRRSSAAATGSASCSTTCASRGSIPSSADGGGRSRPRSSGCAGTGPATPEPAAPPVPDPPSIHKTLDPEDLRREPARSQAVRLRRFLRRLFLRFQPVAVNGVLRRRLRLRPPKLWEYACGLAHAEAERAREVLDFGGGATLPAYWLAARGARVRVFDIDRRLTAATVAAARRFGWRLEASDRDLTRCDLGLEAGLDLVTSFCVIEHLDRGAQRAALRRLAAALRPGGRLALSFEYGAEAPGEGALRDPGEVADLVDHLGLDWVGRAGFEDDGRRFLLDRRHPDRRFTFGLLVLERPA